MRDRLARFKRPLLYVMGPLYVVAGVLHFVVPDLYAQIIPPFLPAPLALVYLSGVAEIAVGIGVLVPQTRRYAAWATIAVLIAIFPANIYMATSMVAVDGISGGNPSPLIRLGRLPLQGVLILWAYWYTDSGADEE